MNTNKEVEWRIFIVPKKVEQVNDHFQLLGALPPDTIPRGFAPEPHWGLCPPDPVIGSRSRALHGVSITTFPTTGFNLKYSPVGV